MRSSFLTEEGRFASLSEGKLGKTVSWGFRKHRMNGGFVSAGQGGTAPQKTGRKAGNLGVVVLSRKK